MSSEETTAAPSKPSNLARGLSWATKLAGLVAILAGIGGAGAVLGVTLGLWNFGIAFAGGGYAAPIALWAGWIALGFAAIIVVGGIAKSDLRYDRAWIYGVIGALIAYPTYTIPRDFRATAMSVPPIHDVSTDTITPPAYVEVAPLREAAGARNSTEFGDVPRSDRAGPLFDESGFNSAILGAIIRTAWPDLGPAFIEETGADAFDRALEAASNMGWEIHAMEFAEGRIEATDTTTWLRFEDDVVIRLIYAANGTWVDVRSTSRIGGSDIGKNASRIQEYLAELQA